MRIRRLLFCAAIGLIGCSGDGGYGNSVLPPVLDRYWQIGANTSWSGCFDVAPSGNICQTGYGNKNIDAPDGRVICASLTQTSTGEITLTCMPDAIIYGPTLSPGESISVCCGP